MRTLIITSITLFICFLSFSQEKYLTKNGVINFEASVPSFEEVKASNSNVSGILNTGTGEFASLALMKGFRFKVALMEEHFNENYVESDKYPKAICKGTIENFDFNELSSEAKTYILKGSLTMHGKTKAIAVPAAIKMNGDRIELTSEFSLNPGDFDIKIPKIVRKKIADKIDVSIQFQLKKK